MEDGGEADAGAQMLRVGGDRGQRLGGGPEQEVVDGGLVLERDRADRSRQGEDDVIIGDRLVRNLEYLIRGGARWIRTRDTVFRTA